ncbi:hypothetical protein [Neisseria sp.]|uniref:hypothetical protein n=1 Tax=Neisseria sp. TaxID=192066 RepID=UPI0035A027EC
MKIWNIPCLRDAKKGRLKRFRRPFLGSPPAASELGNAQSKRPALLSDGFNTRLHCHRGKN